MIIFRICSYDWFANITLHQWLETTSSNKTNLVLSFFPTSLLKTLAGGQKSLGYVERVGQKVKGALEGGQKS